MFRERNWPWNVIISDCQSTIPQVVFELTNMNRVLPLKVNSIDGVNTKSLFIYLRSFVVSYLIEIKMDWFWVMVAVDMTSENKKTNKQEAV